MGLLHSLVIVFCANIPFRHLTVSHSFPEQYCSFLDPWPNLRLNLTLGFNVISVIAKTNCCFPRASSASHRTWSQWSSREVPTRCRSPPEPRHTRSTIHQTQTTHAAPLSSLSFHPPMSVEKTVLPRSLVWVDSVRTCI